MTTSDVSSINKPSPDHRNGVVHRKGLAQPQTPMLDSSPDSVHVRKRDHVGQMTDDDRQEMGDFSSNSDSKASDRPQSLSPNDVPNFILLVVLYLLQGIPVGLSFGSIPFLLKAKMSYSEIAIFSLSSWPYSLKLLWSPIVDALYWPELGRRKSWIIPIQTLTGMLFLALGWHIDAIMAEVSQRVLP
jgi:MFS transporter, PAT family, solute carrier family 33 (acetyl-CoA transportor), member 1